jgi:hypothetical protein
MLVHPALGTALKVPPLPLAVAVMAPITSVPLPVLLTVSTIGSGAALHIAAPPLVVGHAAKLTAVGAMEMPAAH